MENSGATAREHSETGGGSPSKYGALVWNFPMRIFHWGFAASFTGSWVLGEYFNPESDIFKYHMVLGILAGLFLVARIVFGLFGSRHAKWTRFFFTPWHTLRYFWDAARFRTKNYTGINPGTSMVAIGMYLAVAGLLYTGFHPEYVENWHEIIAQAFLWLVGLHLAGLALHTISHREWIALAMITGRKHGLPGEGLAKDNWIGGWAFLFLCLLATAALYFSFNVLESTLNIPGLPTIFLPIVQMG